MKTHALSALAVVVSSTSLLIAAPQLDGDPTKAAPPPAHRVERVKIGDRPYIRREIRANSHTPSRQNGATLARSAEGDLVVAWQSRRQRDGLDGVFFQRFDAAGRRVGEESGVRVADRRMQRVPSLLAAAGKWLTFESFDMLDKGAGLNLARGLDQAPVRFGAGQCRNAAMLPLKDGAVIVVFVQLDELGRPTVWQQRFAADGSKAGRAVALADEDQSYFSDLPVLAANGDGGYVVAWARTDAERMPCGLALRRFDRDGAPLAEEVAISGGKPLGSIEPSIAELPGSGFVLAWHDNGGERDHYDVLAQRFDTEARRLGETMIITEAKQRLSGACVAASSFDGGRICFAWNRCEANGLDSDIVARQFNLAGEPVGGIFAVTANRTGDQQLTAAGNSATLAFGDDGVLAFAWSGDASLGDGTGAHLTTYLPASHALAKSALSADDGVRRVAKIKQTAVDSTDIAAPHDPPVFIKDIPQSRGVDPKTPVARLGGAGDFGFVGITDTGWVPPDPRAAVGPRHLASFSNGAIAFFTKDGKRTFFQPLHGAKGFWGKQGAGNRVFDPRVDFDIYSGRFVACALEHDVGNGFPPYRGLVYLAVSDDDDPNGTWHKDSFDVTSWAGTHFIDYPHLGVDENAIYIGLDTVTLTAREQTFLIFDKKPLLAGKKAKTPKVHVTQAVRSAAMCAQRGRPPAQIMVSIEGERLGTQALLIQAWMNPLTKPTPKTARLPVSVFAFPTSVPQLGTTIYLYPAGLRIIKVAVRDKRVYASHTIKKGKRNIVRWYEIDLGTWPTSGSPKLVQWGEIVGLDKVHTFLPSIDVDIYGNVCVCYAQSSPTEKPSIRRAFRKVTDKAGLMANRLTVKTSATNYQRIRWGDYSSVLLDPRDQATFWYCHEYATSTTTWNTWIGKVRVQRPTLTADKTTVSAGSGGKVTFKLDNPAYGNQTFFMIAGLSGTSPGFRLPTAPHVVNMDLNPDLLTNIVLANMNSQWFTNFAGRLDKAGKATAVFNMPALPSFAGLKFHFAYGQGNNRFDFASETVDVDLVK